MLFLLYKERAGYLYIIYYRAYYIIGHRVGYIYFKVFVHWPYIIGKALFMLQQPIIYGLPKTCCEHGRPTGIIPVPAIFPLSQQQCKGLLLCWHGWCDSSTNSSARQEANGLHRSRGFASDGRKRTPARPASVDGISPISNPPLLFNELPLMVISSPPLVPSRATPDTKFPQPTTEEQQAVIGSPAACSPRLMLGLFFLP